ncbi:MAG: efflux RND transporter permease subunit [Candidatus Delongbacteria bacterium]|jgi:multidrug efflux pump subunit AcrB|nr:efflux RND transporter permease subunit [Candidatus Delongbacteria bacterium]
MLKNILLRPITIIMIFTAVTVFGIISYNKLPVNLLPDIKYPSVTVWTEMEGSSPEEVERLLTEPLEASIAGLKGIKSIKSESKEDISLITIDFIWGTDMDFTVLYLREKLDAADLPETAERPNILRIDPGKKPIMILSVTGKDTKAARDVSEHIIKKRIEQIDGVAMADVIGGEEVEIRVEADIDKLNSFGISFNTLTNAVRSANTNSSGGTVKDDVYIYDLVISSEITELSDIENTLVKQLQNKRNIYIKDVADVGYSDKEKKSFTRYNGENSTGILIRKDGDANAVIVSGLVKEVMEEFKGTLDVDLNIVYDQSDFISESINNVVTAILLGGILSFLTLFLFLRDFKSPLNISLAMPISIFATFSLLYFSKISLNLMSLSGFALGIGMLVDNSIVVLENITRHRNLGKKIFDACYDGVKEVILPVSASTFTTIIVFMPVIFVSGAAGVLFKDQSISVAFALISSLFVSLTLVPVLYSKFSMEKKETRTEDKSVKSDNGVVFKTGIYWAVMIALFFIIVKISKIPIDEHALVYVLFLALMADPILKSIEFFIGKNKGLNTKIKMNFYLINFIWLIILLLLSIPAAFITKIDYFEPFHQLLSLTDIPFLIDTVDNFLYDISTFINDLLQPYEEELSTNGFMFYAYILGGIVFVINLFGLFNPAKFYKVDKERLKSVFYLTRIRKFLKLVTFGSVGILIGLFVFWGKIFVKFVLFISKPILVGFDKSYAWFEEKYHMVLLKALDNKKITLALAFGVIIISLLLSLGIEKRMMPDVDSHEFILSVELNPGTSIFRTEKIITDYENMIENMDGVVSLFSTGGIYDEKSLLTGATVYKGDIQVKLENNISTKKFINELRPNLSSYNSSMDSDIKLNINTDVSILGEMIKPEQGDISVKISGNNLGNLIEVSKKVMQELKSLDNLSEVKSDFSGNKPQIQIEFNSKMLEDYNLSKQEISNFIKTMIKGEIAVQITENNKPVDIIVGTNEDLGQNIKNVLKTVYSKNDLVIPLDRLVTINYVNGPEAIKHESQNRVFTITSNIVDGRFDKVIADVEQTLSSVELYKGMRLVIGGQNSEMQESMKQIIFMFLLSFILVYMVLASQFESLLSPFIIVFSVPFAFIGVTIGLYLTGQSFNILSGIGMIMLIGIVVNDAIVKIDFIENGVKAGLSIRDAIIEASKKRLRPILMTTVSTVFGMIPMAIGWGGSSEIRKPLAVTVIFGLSAATMLILIILPVVFETLKKEKKTVVSD